MRELDREGIDVYQFDGNSFGVKLAVQCKGFEKDWRPDRVSKLKEEVKKFIRKSEPVDEYWLVINRSITDKESRSAIEEVLEECLVEGKARQTKLLDLDKFVKEISTKAYDRYRLLASEARQQTRSVYRHRMATTEYIGRVPFSSKAGTLENPVNYIVEEVEAYIKEAGPHHTGGMRKPPRFLLTGGFGFGKTEALHAIGEHWSKLERDVFFFSAASLSDEAFVNSAGLIREIIIQISDDALLTSDLALKFLQDTCKHQFRVGYPILLIDAIDESAFWHDPERLQMLWETLKMLGVPAAVSVREELLTSRPNEFKTADNPNFFERIHLLDWNSNLMMDFLWSFKAEHEGDSPDSFDRFLSVVQKDDYELKYGDIPRRPLFLTMLVEDAWSGTDPDAKLFMLYGKYFRQKLRRDWVNVVLPGRSVRANRIASRFGSEQAVEELLWMSQEIALHIHDKSSADGLNGIISEAEFRKIIKRTLGDVERIEDVLLSSLMLPAGRDPVTRRRRYRFAHRSYLDWFTARGLVEMGKLEISDEVPEAVARFGKEISIALAAGEPLP